MNLIKVGNKACVFYSNKGQILRYATGVNWNDRNIVKNQKVIASYQSRLQQIIDNYKIENGAKPSVDYVKSELRKGIISDKEYLIDFYNEFLLSKQQDINVKPQSEKDYVSLKNAILDFEKDNGRLLLTDITRNFMISFVSYLSKERPKQGYLTVGKLNDNTVRKRLSSFRTFLHYLIDNKYFIPQPSVMKYHVDRYETPIITLDDEELIALWTWEAGKYEKVRDVFIFGCMTSLRYSDIITLQKKDIINGVINKVAKKSRKDKEKYIVPLNAISKQILEKYDYNLTFYQSQPFNRLLKEMAKESGIFNKKESFIIYRQGEEVNVTEWKYDLISSHTCRRTFITRAIMKNVPINQIMVMSSHKKLDTLLKYIDKYTSKDINYAKFLEI
jgi:integrase